MIWKKNNNIKYIRFNKQQNIKIRFGSLNKFFGLQVK